MELKIDPNKSYGIALEGGGAKGAYQIGVWKAMREIGLKYHMISGTSVGALNGALLCMGDYDLAQSVWENIHLSRIVSLNGMDEDTLLKIFTNQLDLSDLRESVPQLLSILRNRGLDVEPLRNWVRDIVDTKKIRESDVELFVCTYSITDRKGMDIRLNDLPEEEICDMLLASAYFPAFRLEKLGGKLYADGGFVDSLPLDVLLEHNCRDIIAVRLPVVGVKRRPKIPENVTVTTVFTNEDLGSVLEFDADRAKKNIEIGYYDAMRTFYGLYGKHYYIDRTMSETEALIWLTDRYAKRYPDTSIREMCEDVFPQKMRKLKIEDGNYYDLFVAVAERLARKKEIPSLSIRTDRELLNAIS